MTTINEANRDKTKVSVSFFYRNVATYVYANEQSRVCFYVLIRYSLLFSSEIILKQLFPSGSVNIVE